MQERVRICDIAEELGLSPATVSNVIHGKTNKVSDETVQRVTALLEKRQYIPSMAGILLAQNSSGIIGVFVNDHPKYAGHTLRDGFIAASLDALSTEIEAGGQFMMVKKAQCAGEVVRFASMWNMDGIVMIGFCEQDYMDLRRHIRIPIAVYDGLCGQLERMLNLSIDNYGGGYLVGCHFRELGHRELLCVSDNETGIDRARIEGFRHGAAPGGSRANRKPDADAGAGLSGGRNAVARRPARRLHPALLRGRFARLGQAGGRPDEKSLSQGAAAKMKAGCTSAEVRKNLRPTKRGRGDFCRDPFSYDA